MSLEPRVQRVRRLLAGIEKNHSSAVLESGFGAEDMVLLDLIARDGLAIGVVTVDTGRLPRQTHELIDDVRRRYGIEVHVYSPWPDSVSAYVEHHGHNGFYEGVAERHACCTVQESERSRRVDSAMISRSMSSGKYSDCFCFSVDAISVFPPGPDARASHGFRQLRDRDGKGPAGNPYLIHNSPRPGAPRC